METDNIRSFIARVEQALSRRTLVKLTLTRPLAAAGDMVRVSIRPVVIKGAEAVCAVYSHPTRDVTKNLDGAQVVQQLQAFVPAAFSRAHLHTTTELIELMVSKKGKVTILTSPQHGAAPAPVHDRAKHRYVDVHRAFLVALGVTSSPGQLVPAMSRKWKQINKFVEVLDHALSQSALSHAQDVSVIDFGSGKGYLTFALHDHLDRVLARRAQVLGVELRADMVELCQRVVDDLDVKGLKFEQGDVRTVAPAAVDIVIALHACDTATDHAIHTGVRAGAAIIMCSPCCHKELRPQLLSPHPLRPLLKHGVHLGQSAEMLTDALRAMLLEACGYDTQVFEFVSLEHTSKNKMILAVKRDRPSTADVIWQEIRELKDFYGVRDQCLETLLRDDRPVPQV